MPALRVIKKTAVLWGVSAHLPTVLRAPDQLNKTRQGQQGANNARCDCSGEELPSKRGNPAGIEITATSFYNKGWEY